MSEFFIDSNLELENRLDLEKFLYTDNSEFLHDPLTSSFLDSILNLKPRIKFLVRGEDFRPDYISYKVYDGDTQYWWVVMFYNGIYDRNDLVTGMVLNLPSIDQIEDVYFSLKKNKTSQSKIL